MHGLELIPGGLPPAESDSVFHYTTAAGDLSRMEVSVDDGECVLRFSAAPGLHQFSVVADASEFDWDELYIELNAFHNENQRTGPWDFDLLHENRPLVPSYWVYLDGQKLGLWYFQRVSLEDMEARRFRGRTAFWLQTDGEHELRLQPYREMNLRWMSARLETDPEDTLLPEAPNAPGNLDGLPYGRAFWTRKKTELESTHAMYREPLQRAFEVVKGLEEPEPNEWIVLLAAYFIEDDEEALTRLLKCVDAHLDKAVWNNPREDGYGYNGDMGAAFPLRAFALVLLSLGEELGAEHRERMLRKAELQGSLFIRQALLNRDYWGGSVLQDHGWRSTLSFCCAALRLAPILPAANEWLRYILPRAHRALAAMPRDGVVPESSHNSLILYLDDVSELREELLRWNGEDLYDHYPFREIVEYVAAVHAPAGRAMMVGGSGFFNEIASKYGCPQAAAIQRRLLETEELDWAHPTVRIGYYSNIVRGFMTYDPRVVPAESLAVPPFHWFADTGLVHYRDADNGVTFMARCGPWVGRHADHYATGPCDRMGLAPGAGHFSLTRDGMDLLATPDGGYSLQSALRSCLLIDGRGQHGDVGYPMSIPSWLHGGQSIERACWDDATRTGSVRMQLAPAYPAEAGVAAYTRDFLISSRRLIVRDYVVLNQPKVLTWLFQLKRENGIDLQADAEGGYTAAIGGEQGVRFSVRPDCLYLRAEIRQTPVVWSYTSINGFRPFDSLCFHSAEPVAAVALDFQIRW